MATTTGKTTSEVPPASCSVGVAAANKQLKHHQGQPARLAFFAAGDGAEHRLYSRFIEQRQPQSSTPASLRRILAPARTPACAAASCRARGDACFHPVV